MNSGGDGIDGADADRDTPLRDPTPNEADAPGRRYVVVFEAASSWMFELPAAGEVLVGRGEDAQLRLSDTGISRRHALIRTAAGHEMLVDEGSQNGTRVNGERVVGARPLASVGCSRDVSSGDRGPDPAGPATYRVTGAGNLQRAVSIAQGDLICLRKYDSDSGRRSVSSFQLDC